MEYYTPKRDIDKAIKDYTAAVDKVLVKKIYELASMVFQQGDYGLASALHNLADDPVKDSMDIIRDMGYAIEVKTPQFVTSWDEDEMTAEAIMDLDKISIKLIKTVVEV
jgi:hypothetical protein